MAEPSPSRDRDIIEAYIEDKGLVPLMAEYIALLCENLPEQPEKFLYASLQERVGHPFLSSLSRRVEEATADSQDALFQLFTLESDISESRHESNPDHAEVADGYVQQIMTSMEKVVGNQKLSTQLSHTLVERYSQIKKSRASERRLHKVQMKLLTSQIKEHQTQVRITELGRQKEELEAQLRLLKERAGPVCDRESLSRLTDKVAELQKVVAQKDVSQYVALVDKLTLQLNAKELENKELKARIESLGEGRRGWHFASPLSRFLGDKSASSRTRDRSSSTPEPPSPHIMSRSTLSYDEGALSDAGVGRGWESRRDKRSSLSPSANNIEKAVNAAIKETFDTVKLGANDAVKLETNEKPKKRKGRRKSSLHSDPPSDPPPAQDASPPREGPQTSGIQSRRDVLEPTLIARESGVPVILVGIAGLFLICLGAVAALLFAREGKLVA